MKDFDHLLSVWQGQPKRVRLSVDDVLKLVKKGLSKLKARLLTGVIAVALSMLGIILIALFSPIHHDLTYVGLGIWLIVMFAFILLQIGDYRVISSLDITTDPATYLSHMKLYKKRRAYMNGRFYYYYALAISIGVALYADEFIGHKSLTFKYYFYIFWLLYLAFVTFYWKKKLIAREDKRVAELIERLENLRKQFE
jgi:MFS family permease